MKNKNIIPAVDRALFIVGYLSGFPDRSIPQTEIIRAADVSATTGYRILQTLMNHDWLRKNPDGGYTLTISSVSGFLSDRTGADFRKNAQELLNAVSARTGLASKYSVRRGADQLTLLRAESPGPFSVSGKTGSCFPLVEGTVGAALLSEEDESEIRRLCAVCPKGLVERNNPELVLARIESIHEKGYVMMSAGKNRWRVDAMSIPVKNGIEKYPGAVTLLGIGDDFTPEKESALFKIMRKTLEDFQYIIKKGE